MITGHSQGSPRFVRGILALTIRTIRTSSTYAIRARSTVRTLSKRATKDASYKTDRAHKTHNLNTSSNYIRML